MSIRWLLAACTVTLAITAAARPATATVLTYEVIGAANATLIPQDYGDRVTQESDSRFRHGTAGGFTPNVLVTHGRDGVGVALWDYGFGDLQNVLYSYDLAAPLEVRFAADPGFQVTLDSFDLAGWPGRDLIIDSIEVLNVAGQTLYFQRNALVEGDLNGPRHTRIAFAEPLADVALTIRVDSRNLRDLADDVGIDNIRFGQVALVPAPPGLAMLALGAPVLLAACRRRSRRPGVAPGTPDPGGEARYGGKGAAGTAV